MKVMLSREAEKLVTLEEAPAAEEIIRHMEKEEPEACFYAEMAVRAALGGRSCSIEMLRTSAQIGKNSRVWNIHGACSGSLDVWIEAFAYACPDEIIAAGAYLSDIWQITGNAAEDEKLLQHMYIRRFRETG